MAAPFEAQESPQNPLPLPGCAYSEQHISGAKPTSAALSNADTTERKRQLRRAGDRGRGGLPLLVVDQRVHPGLDKRTVNPERNEDRE